MWAAGERWTTSVRGLLLRWDGASWKDAKSPPNTQYCGPIWGTASDDVWVGCMGRCGEAFYVFHWDGGSWKRTATLDWYPKSFWGSGRNDVWLVGHGGPICGVGHVCQGGTDASVPADATPDGLSDAATADGPADAGAD